MIALLRWRRFLGISGGVLLFFLLMVHSCLGKIRNDEDLQHFKLELSCRVHIANRVYKPKNDSSFINKDFDYYKDSVFEVIPKAVTDCAMKKDVFATEKIENGVVFFGKTNAKDYNRANWNAVVLYNWIYNVLLSKKVKIEVTEFSKNIVSQYKKKYDIDCAEQIDLAVTDIQQYIQALKLRSYLTNVIQQKLKVKTIGSLSGGDLELNIPKVWLKNRNGNVSKQSLQVKIESGEPCYEFKKCNKLTPASSYLCGIPMMEIHKLSINKYMQIENSELKEYEFTFNTSRVMTNVPHLITMVTTETQGEIQITKLQLKNPLSNTVPIRYVIYGKVADKTVVFKQWENALRPKIQTFGGPIVLQFKETDGAKVKLPKYCYNVFSRCHNLIEIDMSGCDTSQTSAIRGMFENCTGLKKIKGLNKLVTKNVTALNSLFAYCGNLTELDLKDWDTSNVTDMSQMFLGCHQLRKINISNFKLDNIKTMFDMFAYCTSLQEIDLKRPNEQETVALQNMENMFIGCSSLKTAKLGCLNTSNVSYMANMFRGCSALEELDLASFSTKESSDMDDMFRDCVNLKKLNISETFSKKRGCTCSGMFINCDHLSPEIKDRFK